MDGYICVAGEWTVLGLFILKLVPFCLWELMFICKTFVYKKGRQWRYIWILLWWYKPNKSNFNQNLQKWYYVERYSPKVRKIGRWADFRKGTSNMNEHESFSHEASINIQEWMEEWLIEYYSQRTGAPDISHE